MPKSSKTKRTNAPKAHILEPKAFALYRSGKHSQSTISEMVGVSVQTISTWKKEFDWDSRLAKLSASTRRSSDKLREILAKMIDEMEDGSNADAIHKLSLVLEKMDGHFDRLAFTIEIMEDFNDFLNSNYPSLTAQFHEVLSPFLNEQGKKYGN